MNKEFNNNSPIYIQIMDEIKLQIISGFYQPGTKISSVRDLAEKFGVNPNTMQRALSELEREGFLYTERTNGRFITMDEKLIMNSREMIAEEELERFLSYMKKIGYSKQEIIHKIETAQILSEGDKESDIIE